MWIGGLDVLFYKFLTTLSELKNFIRRIKMIRLLHARIRKLTNNLPLEYGLNTNFLSGEYKKIIPSDSNNKPCKPLAPKQISKQEKHREKINVFFYCWKRFGAMSGSVWPRFNQVMNIVRLGLAHNGVRIPRSMSWPLADPCTLVTLWFGS